MKTASIFGKCFLPAVVALGFGPLGCLFAQPVVDYTVTGVSGDFTLDFTINNATPGTGGQDIYLLGIYDPDAIVTSTPASYSSDGPLNPYAFFNVGSTLVYNDSWYDGSFSALPTGTTLSGFSILDTSVAAPAFIPYVAAGYDFDANYSGPGNLAPSFAANPLFEGNAAVVVSDDNGNGNGNGNGGASAPDSGPTIFLLTLALIAIAGACHQGKVKIIGDSCPLN